VTVAYGRVVVSLNQSDNNRHNMEQAPSVDRARARVMTYYHQLFPELFSTGLSPSPCASTDPMFDLTDEELNAGWRSQPKEFDYDVEIEGEVPKEFRGTLYRNGPGLLEVYGTPLVHPIDGDGMVCSLSFAGDGKVRFRSKYVKTSGYVAEKEAKRMIFKGMMGTKPPTSWTESISEWTTDIKRGKLPNQRFKNPSNTNCYYWGGKLLSSWESGLPYNLDPKTLETHGKDTLNGALSESGCLAAHFRYDRLRDCLVTFSFKLSPSSCKLFIHEFDREWNLISQQVHSFEKFYYCHDFILTQNYYIFHHTPFYKLSKEVITKIILGVVSPGESMKWYPDVPSGFIVIPRDLDANKNIRFFESEPCMIYHHVNGFEEGDKIHFSSCCLGKKFKMGFDRQYFLSNTSVAPGHIFNYTIDLANDTIFRAQADFASCEFPTCHPEKMGEDWRYAYLMASDAPGKVIPFQEIVKFDRKGESRSVWSSRTECSVIGEPLFVPRNHIPPGSGYLREEDEDDGWVITQLFNCKEERSEFVILDARNLEAGPIARLKLKHHIPYGFHGTFCPEVF